MYQLWYKKAFKTLEMYIGTTYYPDNFYASTMFSHAAKVYYELSTRFGTRNVLTRTQGWIYWGGSWGVHPPSPGQRGCRGGAIFHDKAKNC
jgi:hypothetical protein